MRKILVSRKLLLYGNTSQGALFAGFRTIQKGETYSIKRMYASLLPQYPKVEWISCTLHSYVHRFKFILWLAVQNRLAIVERLLKFRIQVPPDCAYYGSTVESFDYLYFECLITRIL